MGDAEGTPARRGLVRKVTRREVLAAGLAGGAGLLLGVTFGTWRERKSRAARTQPFAPDAFVGIDHDGTVTIHVAKSEMGQGVRTALPMLVAEELDADWRSVRVAPCLVDERFGEQGTAVSSSVRTSWDRLRHAGAVARAMLVTAAAGAWDVAATELRTENGTVIHDATGRSIAYGALVAAANALPVPAAVPLKTRAAERLLGTRPPRTDVPAKVDGSARFGLDVRLPGMLYAVVRRSPVLGARVRSHDATRARALAGVRDVVEIGSGIAVVGDTTWHALRGRDALEVTWTDSPHATLSSPSIAALLATLTDGDGAVVRADGDALAALAAAEQRVEAVYELPYLAHATMEPINCTVRIGDGTCEVWAPTQAPAGVQNSAKDVLGLPWDAITVHTTLLGGGFGRRVEQAEVREALAIARAVGRPVQVFWSRDDDIRHDFYRPVARHRLEAALAGPEVAAWRHRIACPAIAARDAAWTGPIDATSVEGSDIPYDLPAVRIEYAHAAIPIPVGFWRSVGHSHTAFAVESFVDELAHAAGVDPLAWRRARLARVGSSRVDLQACKLEYSIVSPK